MVYGSQPQLVHSWWCGRWITSHPLKLPAWDTDVERKVVLQFHVSFLGMASIVTGRWSSKVLQSKVCWFLMIYKPYSDEIELLIDGPSWNGFSTGLPWSMSHELWCKSPYSFCRWKSPMVCCSIPKSLVPSYFFFIVYPTCWSKITMKIHIQSYSHVFLLFFGGKSQVSRWKWWKHMDKSHVSGGTLWWTNISM